MTILIPWANPLGWPPHRQRTSSLKHTWGPFKDGGSSVTEHAARGRVSDQLRMLEPWGAAIGDAKLGSEAPARIDGGLKAGHKSRIEDVAVTVHFRWHGAWTVVGCDLFSRLAQNAAGAARQLEAFRVLERYGGAGALDAAMRGHALALPGSIASRHWTAVLGVDEGVSIVDAKARYRQLAATLHPDRGGDASAFAELERAMRDAADALGGSA